METRILLVECADRAGLVHDVTGVLYRHGCNVLVNGEFVDEPSGRFFMRTEFTGGTTDEALTKEIARTLPEGCVTRLSSRRKPRVVVLCTREWHCLGDLLLRHQFGDLGAEIVAVAGNHGDLGDLVRRFGIPFLHVESAGRDREDHEAALLEAIAPFDPEFLVLAKYMRVLSPAFLARWPARIVNIHHSFLPAFSGAHPYRQAFERGVKLIGATAHLVTEDLDEGPILAQDTVRVDHSQGVAALVRAGRDVERRVLAEGLRLVWEERVFLCGRRTILFE